MNRTRASLACLLLALVALLAPATHAYAKTPAKITAKALAATPGVSKLEAQLPSWCGVDPAANKTWYGDRFSACQLGLARYPGSANGDVPPITLEVAILVTTNPRKNTATYTYYAAVSDIVTTDPQKLIWPVLVSADAPVCGSGCSSSVSGFESAYIKVPYDTLAKFQFTITRTVASGSVVSSPVSLPIGVGMDQGLDGIQWSQRGNAPAPNARCDTALPGLPTFSGCVFADYVPKWNMDWRPSGVLDSNPGYAQVAAHIQAAQNIMGTQKQVLHRTDEDRKNTNRKNACAKVRDLNPTFDETQAKLLPGTYSCDEYPFASTDEGGMAFGPSGTGIGSPYLTSSYVASGRVPPLTAQSRLSIAPLLNRQNSIHGSALNSFYLANRILPRRGTTTGDGFTVGFVTNPPVYTPPSPTPEPTTLACTPVGSGSLAAALRAVANACAKVGNTSYTYGGGHSPYPGPTFGYYDGEDPASANDGTVFGFDCSGFVRWVWYLATGQDFLDGSSQMQRNKLAASPSAATLVSRDKMLPGDVLFFGGAGRVHHVALYLGDNKVVEARQSGTKIMVSSLSSHDDFYEAYRPLVSGAAQSDPGGNGYVWATNVNVRSTPSASGALLSTIPGQQTVSISCQAPGSSVSVGTATSTYWSRVPALGNGWVSNVFLRGGAVLAGVPACAGSSLPPATTTTGKYQVWASNVNVRATPSVSGAKAGTIATPTTVDISCQAAGEKVTDSGYSSTYWSKIASPAGYISNVYIKGTDKLDGVPMCAGNSTPPTRNDYFQTWATSVNIRSAANTTASVVGTITNPSTVNVICQTPGQSVTDNGYTSTYWSRLAEPAVGYISNVYITGPAKLPNVPDC